MHQSVYNVFILYDIIYKEYMAICRKIIVDTDQQNTYKVATVFYIKWIKNWTHLSIVTTV